MARPWYGGKGESSPTLFGAFDVETHGLGGQLVAGSLATPDGQTAFYSGEPDAICAALYARMWEYPYSRNHRNIWYAHNAQYDWRYLLLYALRQHWVIDVGLRSDTDIYQVKVSADFGDGVHTDEARRGQPILRTIVMRDSYALFQNTLAAFTQLFAPEIPKGYIPFEHGVLFDPENQEHVNYSIRDVESLRLALIRYNETIRADFGVSLRATQASTAIAAWENTLEDTYYPSEGFAESWGRAAYYGGLVFLTDVKLHRNVCTYDINSSYPDRMRTCGVPLGRGAATSKLQFTKPAFYDVTVSAPEGLRIPILPARRNGLMCLPSGIFRTIVSNDELAFAMEHGYEILQLHGGYEFETLAYPFKDFVDRSERIRQENKKNARDDAAKRMQNSNYGKYGTRKTRKRLLFLSNEQMPPLGAEPWSIEDNIWVITEDADVAARPEWAAWITAQARLNLLRAAYAIGPEHVIYGDTDSLVCAPEHATKLDLGSAYGQWKREKSWMVFRAVAPKVYAGARHTDYGPALAGAAKGLNKHAMRAGHWRDLTDGRQIEVTAESLRSLLQLLKDHGTQIARPLTRKSTDIRKSRNVCLDPKTDTVAPRPLPQTRQKSAAR